MWWCEVSYIVEINGFISDFSYLKDVSERFYYIYLSYYYFVIKNIIQYKIDDLSIN